MIVEHVRLSYVNHNNLPSRFRVKGGGSLLLVIINLVQTIWRRNLLIHMSSFTQASHFFRLVHRSLAHTLARLQEPLPFWIMELALDCILLVTYQSTSLGPHNHISTYTFHNDPLQNHILYRVSYSTAKGWMLEHVEDKDMRVLAWLIASATIQGNDPTPVIEQQKRESLGLY